MQDKSRRELPQEPIELQNTINFGQRLEGVDRRGGGPPLGVEQAAVHARPLDINSYIYIT